MNTVAKYGLLTIAFMFLSSGVLVAGFLDVYNTVGYGIFWLLIPMTALFISAVLVNDRVLIPRMLLRSRLGAYCASVFGIVYLLTLVSLAIEYVTRCVLHLPMRIADYSSPWILADTLGNGLLLAMILLGLGLLHLFNRWQQEVHTETCMTARLQAYISTVKDRLNPALIFEKLSSIVIDKTACSEDIDARIRELSLYLREQLYELPHPPKLPPIDIVTSASSRVTSWLVSKRFRSARHIVFLSILVIISCGAFFNSPDNPEFTLDRFWGVLSMLGVLVFIAYINILWLYPRFMKRGNMKKYALSVAAMLLLIVIPMIVLQIITYEPNIYTKQLPPVIALISTIGSLLTLFLFIGGISAVLLLQNWIETKRRLTLLQAETIREEYSYLRKQINPHFLFNVLNNIGITVYDDPDCARGLINDLISLLKYQLEDMGRETTTLSREISFISNYFALEATRRETFDYSIATNDIEDDPTLPTFLFIPFVENAAKYSSHHDGCRQVEVSFSSVGGRLRFVCTNRFDADRFDTLSRGGIGLANTRRRLDLLYDDRYVLTCEIVEMTYIVKLEIPVK